MHARTWIGPLFLLLCSLSAGAQEEFAASQFSSSRPLASVTTRTTQAQSTLYTALPFSPMLSSTSWLTSPELISTVIAQARAASMDACAQRYPQPLMEAPGGGVGPQPLITMAMFREAMTREHMVKMAKDFVPKNGLPDAPSYTPLTSHEKFVGWAKHTYSADMFVGTAIDAAILQMTGAYPTYHGGMTGYGQRYGTALISAEASSLFGRWLFPTLLHQDPRYFPSHQTNVLDRMAYAASRTIITRSDDGRDVFNSSLILTLLFSSALANGYKPNYDESFQATLANAAAGLGATAQMHLLDEFWPDLKRILTKAEPRVLKQAQDETDKRWQDFSSVHLSKKHNQQ